jgi:hypothetical protein
LKTSGGEQRVGGEAHNGGERKVERRQALVVKGMAAEVAKAVQPLWTKLARTSALDFEKHPFGL